MKDKIEPEVRLYEVRGSLPPEEGRGWRRNFATHVLAPNLVTAAEHVLSTRPDGTVLHDVLCRSSGQPVEWAERAE